MLGGEVSAEDVIESEDIIVDDSEVILPGQAFSCSMGKFEEILHNLTVLKWPYTTVSSVVWSPFKAILQSPKNTALSFFPTAAVLTFITGTLSFLSFLVTPYGTFFNFVGSAPLSCCICANDGFSWTFVNSG